jgi:N-acetyl sugar amidotransferase
MLKFCSKCVMDGTADEIILDKNRVCNFCHQAQKSLKEIEADKHKLPELIERIKQDGKDRDYDCLMGLSGGADSSTVLHHAVKSGLRLLCFSFDNRYNDPKADANVKKLVEKLNLKHIVCKVDMAKYHKLQSAFLKSGVPNIEIPTDHILMAMTYQIASKYSIKWVLSGGNVATESIMPPSWGYSARDLRHIKDIYKKMTGERLTGLPVCGLFKWNWYKWVKKISIVYPLDYMDYNRTDSVNMLAKEYGFEDYHEKHCESLFTWWFQNFYLFEKFGIDKRKAHLSSLINSGQMTRKEAMDLLAERPVYPTLGIEARALGYPKHSHDDFKKDEKLFNFISKVVKLLR